MKIFKDPYLKHLSAAFLLLHIQMISQKGVCWSALQIINLGSTLLGSSTSTPENIYGNLQLFAVFLCEGQFLNCHFNFFSYVISKVSKPSEAVGCGSNKPPDLLRYQLGRYGLKFELEFAGSPQGKFHRRFTGEICEI